MKIIIEQKEGKWQVTFDNGMPVIKYNSLLKLCKALMAYAKGQNL